MKVVGAFAVQRWCWESPRGNNPLANGGAADVVGIRGVYVDASIVRGESLHRWCCH